MLNRSSFKPMVLAFTLCLIVSGCASYAGSRLKAGISSLSEVVAEMGEPAMRWKGADGSEQLAYPRGPDGPHTYMAFVGPDGRLQKIVNVLDTPYFGRLEPGKSDQAAVLRLFGPSVPQWTVYFQARNELVWEWLFCDETSHLARFDVLFDGTTGIVRSSFQRPDRRGPDGIVPLCGR